MKDKFSLEYRVKGHDVLVYEQRLYWRDPNEITETPVAKIKLVRIVNEWRLYWMRRDLKWHGYEMLPSSKDLKDLVDEIDADQYACFFG